MKLKATYNTGSNRPQLVGQLFIPLLGITAFVPFMIDTGSDCTVLMPADAEVIQLDYGRLGGSPRVTSYGAGGESSDYLVAAILAFPDDDGDLHAYEVQLRISPRNESLVSAKAPSMLGRDVLGRWRMLLEPSTATIDIWAIDADAVHKNTP